MKKTFIFLALFSILLVSCDKLFQDDLVGTWKIVKAIEYDERGNTETSNINGFIEFKKNGDVDIIDDNRKRASRYERKGNIVFIYENNNKVITAKIIKLDEKNLKLEIEEGNSKGELTLEKI